MLRNLVNDLESPLGQASSIMRFPERVGNMGVGEHRPDDQVVQHPLKVLLKALDDLGGVLGVVKGLDFANGPLSPRREVPQS